ncbi:unnamed protein product [Thlaspi arvense]|uniref:DNA repair RAD52-like protein 1, mitochondrial n=1 Tax=Thlaspi arvense TaxID=13288 RepID=A0AAU9SKQ3_THLAR|nr:unnamed protein product [Thlaspi arvense]
MASLGLRLKSATWTLRSGAAAVSRRCSWELGKGFRGFCAEAENDVVPTSGISRPLAEILKELNKKVPDSVIKTRVEDGFAMKYIPWHIVNRIMNLHAPEWSGEVRSVTYSPDGNTVTVAYRVTLYGTDAEVFPSSLPICSDLITNGGVLCLLVREAAKARDLVTAPFACVHLTSPIWKSITNSIIVCVVKIFRESTGTTSVNEKGYGDAVQKAEAMAFRRACARLGLGLHLYHEDAL